jgi:membrane protein YdbS with pleckstrin-like domain
MLENDLSNQPVNLVDLPGISNLEKHALSTKYAPINRLINLLTTFFILLIGLVIYFQPLVNLPAGLRDSLPLLIWAFAIVRLLMTWYHFHSDQHKFYALREQDLHYSSGVFFCKTVSQPVSRIQHMELKRGPIERKIGLAKLQVFSAGGDMHTFQIPGLPVDRAQQLRQFILDHKDVAHDG